VGCEYSKYDPPQAWFAVSPSIYRVAHRIIYRIKKIVYNPEFPAAAAGRRLKTYYLREGLVVVAAADNDDDRYAITHNPGNVGPGCIEVNLE
jgi:hypothetical protein